MSAGSTTGLLMSNSTYGVVNTSKIVIIVLLYSSLMVKLDEVASSDSWWVVMLRML